jgi:hypothetical protein
MYTSIMQGGQALTITEDVEDLDLAKYVLGGQLRLILTINPGVTVGSSISGGPAIFSSATVLASKSHFTLRCNGTIIGSNGAGGYSSSDDKDGIRGGTGVKLSCPMTIYMISGLLHSGGGGGGCGSANITQSQPAVGGGGGFPGGYTPKKSTYPGSTDGTTAQYGYAAGGIGKPTSGTVKAGDGGACNGAGQAGDAGMRRGSDWDEGAGGPAGYSIDASGSTVTVENGAANILGAIV